jgi:3-oxoacyl-[acyl-carrier-protein] synthase III
MLVKIVGTGRYLPERVETSEELAPRLGVTADWIISHTGVMRRHISDLPMAQMAARAARQALGDGPAPDLIINAGSIPKQLVPDSSVFIQEELGFSGIPSFTINATSLSFPVALYNAAGLICAGAHRRVLIVSSEIGSRSRNFNESESAALFGDGAGAAVLEATPEGESSELLGFRMRTWPQGSSLTEVRGGGTRQHPQDPTTKPEDNLLHMNGPGMYKMALRRMPAVFKQVFNDCGVAPRDLQAIIPHQTSGRALSTGHRFGLDPDRVISRVQEEGNCIGASIPMALAYAHQEGRITRGGLVLLCGTGAGLSTLAMLLRW